MTMDQIKAAWRKSQMNPVLDNGSIKPGSTHAQFPEDMAKKTLLNHACKLIVNTSDDSDLLIRAFRESDQDLAEAQQLETISDNANCGPIIGTVVSTPSR